MSVLGDTVLRFAVDSLGKADDRTETRESRQVNALTGIGWALLALAETARQYVEEMHDGE